MSEYIFQIPIGDWSHDGHEKCTWYTIKSNRPVEDIREMYFKLCEDYQVKLDGHSAPCSKNNDGDCLFPVEWFKKAKLYDWLKKEMKDIEEFTEQTEFIEMDPDFMIDILLGWIHTNFPETHFEILEGPMFPFFGVDEKNRHIGHIGYGLFG